jgi:uncharacterized iron-regulated membrane protein
MNNLRVKVLVDVGMAVAMLVSLATGVIIWLVLPHGRYAGRSLFLGITRLLWSDVHTYSSLAFVVILLVHLALNWGLFLAMARCFSRTREMREKSPER